MSNTAIERRKLTVPQLAKLWGVATKKVLGFIRSGELRAVNLASQSSSRPRYAIDRVDIDAFELARQVVPDAGNRATRKRSVQPGVKQFF